ncbi:hypothetical protein OVA29_00825 [Exiguobacterium sp. SL14]|nr:hypothetical protein [Exiguobacterium sp. SL14]MCY1689582.1 hypothetical protein [Exiguobacterium sp. SL14]
MYRNRSPNICIILLIILATSFPIPHSHAKTEELDIPDPLTSSFCEETLNDPKKKNLLEKEELEQCEKLLEIEQKLPTENEDPPTLETPPTENEDSPTPETPPTENEDSPTPETPPTENEDPPTAEIPSTENEDPPTAEIPSTENEDPPTPETPPTESEDPPTSETSPTESGDPPTAEIPPTENEDPPTAEIPSTENEDPPTPETVPTEEGIKVHDQPDSGELESPNEIETPVLEPPKPRQEKKQVVAPTLVGISLLGSSSLDASYNATTQTITLENTVSGLLNLKISNGYIIFQMAPEVIQSIEANSIKLEYMHKSLLGQGNPIEVSNITVDPQNNQLYANVGSLLKLTLLGNDVFTLSFKVGKLPVGVNKTYTFRSLLTDGLVDINLLSNPSATDTLGIGPTFGLTVPSTLDFGSHELTGGEKIIPRLSPMTIGISHENAIGYLWKLQARLSRPLTSTKNDILSDVLYFKTSTTKQLLQDTAIEVAAGKMGTTSSPISLTYAPDEGIVLDLNGKYPKPLSYSADIQWSLINAP